MENYMWYAQLIKPSWAPPSWLFGPVWTVLYIIIGVSFFSVFFSVLKKQLPTKVAIPFILNLIFNAAFTPIQFGLKNNVLASVDITLVLLSLLWCMYNVRKVKRWVAVVNIPYLMWVMFATVLQFVITALNAR